MKTLYFETVGDVLCLVHGPLDPSDEDWSAFMQHMSAYDFRCIFVDSVGGAPTKAQRKEILDFWAKNPEIQVSLTTSSQLVLTAMAALSLLSKRAIRAFRSHALHAAFDYLGIADEDRAPLQEARLRLRAHFL